MLAGYFAGGSNSNNQSFIDKLLFDNDLQSTLTATLSHAVSSQSACNSTSAGYFAGGTNYGDKNMYYYSYIDKLSFDTESRSTLATTLSRTIVSQSACQSDIIISSDSTGSGSTGSGSTGSGSTGSGSGSGSGGSGSGSGSSGSDSGSSGSGSTNIRKFNLTIIKSGSGSGTITSDPPGIDCGSTCSCQFASGINVTLTATPDSSSTFEGWSKNMTGFSPDITIIMDSDKSFEPMFVVKNNNMPGMSGTSSTPGTSGTSSTSGTSYTLTVSTSGTGSGTIELFPLAHPELAMHCKSTCTYQFAAGTTIILSAFEDTSSVFIGWSGDVTSSYSNLTFTMDSNKHLVATFNT
jgi:hypothetical protein